MKIVGLCFRIMIAVCSAVCLVWSFGALNAGTVIGALFFGAVIAVCAAWRPLCGLIKRIWRRIGGRIALISVGVVMLLGAGLCGFIAVNIAVYADEPVETVRAVMIMGCRVRGEEPSLMLQSRMNAALVVLSENPEAVCVASGGMGNGENISEAECMRRYLIDHGIAEERIFTEGESTSTRENFRFSKAIFDELGISDGIVVVTNDFHQYRTELYARRAGLDVGHFSNKTPITSLLNYCIREVPAILSAYLLGG